MLDQVLMILIERSAKTLFLQTASTNQSHRMPTFAPTQKSEKISVIPSSFISHPASYQMRWNRTV